MLLKKLLLVFVILTTTYGVVVFKAPGVSNTLEGWLGLDGLGDKIRGVKTTVDEVSTDIPSLDEVRDTYNKVYSGAVDAKNTLQDGVNNTKDIVDDARKTLSGAQAIYDDAKGVYEETKDVVSGFQDKIDSAKEILEDGQKLQDTLNDSLNTEILE